MAKSFLETADLLRIFGTEKRLEEFTEHERQRKEREDKEAIDKVWETLSEERKQLLIKTFGRKK